MTWATMAPHPVQHPVEVEHVDRDNSMVRAAINGSIIYLYSTCGDQATSNAAGNCLYAYDITNNTWSSKANPGNDGGGYSKAYGFRGYSYYRNVTMSAGSGNLYLLGGNSFDQANVAFKVFVISSNTWVTKTNPSFISKVGDSAFANGKLWVSVCEWSKSSYYTDRDLTSLQLGSYNPANDTWAGTNVSIPSNTVPYSSSITSQGNIVYCLLKDTDTSSVGYYAYDTAANTWTKVSPFAIQITSLLNSATGAPKYIESPNSFVGNGPYLGFSYPAMGMTFISSDLITYANGASDFSAFSLSRNRPELRVADIPGYQGATTSMPYPLSSYIKDKGYDNGGISGGWADYVGYNGSLYYFGAMLNPITKYSDGYGNTYDQYNGLNRNVFRYTPDVATKPVTDLAPQNGATVSTDTPVISATNYTTQDYKIIEWQFAKDSAYTVSAKTIFEYDISTTDTKVVLAAPYQGGGVRTVNIPAAAYAKFSPGTWYGRARNVTGSFVSAWTSSVSFTVAHAPAAATSSPNSDNTYNFKGTGAITFSWLFSDASRTDYQSAYQIIVERNSTGELLLDTGKIASAVKSYNWNLPAAYKDEVIRWKIKVWDSFDSEGQYSTYALFRMSDPPTPTITSPAVGDVVASGRPTVTWSFAASAGRTQASYQVRFYNSNGTLIFDSKSINGTSTSYQPPYQVLDKGNYTVRVDVVDNRGLTNYAQNAFVTNFDIPASPSFNASGSLFASEGRNVVTWTSAQQDANYFSYVVYRKMSTEVSWTQVYETQEIASSYQFDDYSAGSGVYYNYVVVQKAYRFGSLVESSKFDPGQQVTFGTTDKYTLVLIGKPELSFVFNSVSSDDFSDEYESSEVNLIGRGRHIDFGTRWGYKGSLSAELRDNPVASAREQRLALELLVAERETLVLRNPFGDVFSVSVENISIKRIPGTGTSEHVDVTVPYSEVY